MAIDTTHVVPPFQAAATAPATADISVLYAEAFMDGAKSVVVTGRNGEPIRYVFGEEYGLTK